MSFLLGDANLLKQHRLGFLTFLNIFFGAIIVGKKGEDKMTTHSTVSRRPRRSSGEPQSRRAKRDRDRNNRRTKPFGEAETNLRQVKGNPDPQWAGRFHNKKVYLTSDGLKELKKELQRLTEIKRPRMVGQLEQARQPGELIESAEYTQAKEELAFIDGRISELEEVISRATLIDEGHKDCKEVNLGCKVSVHGNGEKHIYHLVGEWEADPAEKKISYQSPLGQSLLGKKVGEKVEVEAPVGKIIYAIQKIC